MNIRRANESDKAQLLAWANTAEAMEASDRAPIMRIEHDIWFKRVLEHDEVKCFIACVDGERCGYVRFDERNAWEVPEFVVSIFVDAEYRGNGAAKRILQQVLDMQIGIADLVAHIKPTNSASIKTFIACGFKHGLGRGTLYWRGL